MFGTDRHVFGQTVRGKTTVAMRARDQFNRFRFCLRVVDVSKAWSTLLFHVGAIECTTVRMAKDAALSQMKFEFRTFHSILAQWTG